MKNNILIVDDEESIRFTFTALLESSGYQARAVGSYEEAMEAVATDPPDLIFSDIILGGRDGIDLVRDLRSKGFDGVVVMITGFPNFQTTREAFQLGVFDYLAKPIDEEQLLEVTTTALNHKSLLLGKRRFQRHVKEFRQHLKAIVDHTDSKIFSVNEQGEIISASAAIRERCPQFTEGSEKNWAGTRLHEQAFCRKALNQTLMGDESTINLQGCCTLQSEAVSMVSVNITRLTPENDQLSGAILCCDPFNSAAPTATESHYCHGTGSVDPHMHQLFSHINTLKDLDSTVLLTGESGTGKEVIAEALHQTGIRKDAPLVKVNCSAFADTLLESELFGHVRGAFTGAVKDRVGCFESAHGGTIFLDEIGDISPLMQLRLLRVLQEREVQPVGGSQPRKIDVRVVAATNRNLPELVEQGRFREDLFYRLRVFQLRLPPLRQRLLDLPLLVEQFINEFNGRFNKNIRTISTEVVTRFTAHSWPGNIRELKNVIEHACILCDQPVITVDHLPEEYKPDSTPAEPGTPSPEEERRQILQALESSAGNRQRAAALLNISRSTLYRKLKEYRIP